MGVGSAPEDVVMSGHGQVQWDLVGWGGGCWLWLLVSS